MEPAPDKRRRGEVRIGLRALLLVVATLMFILGLLLEENAWDVAMIGFACLAGAFLVTELGIDRG